MNNWKPKTTLAKAVYNAGFIYIPARDIIISRQDCPQNQYGYIDFYDDASNFLLMYFDRERIIFPYEDRKWKIELWKGQYGIETGCELGIYRQSSPDSSFYECAVHDTMNMSFKLYNEKGQLIITRDRDDCWWLTGFQWGLFHWPDELKAEYSIKFKNKNMQKAFIGGLEKLEYEKGKDYFLENGNTKIIFNKPKDEQSNFRVLDKMNYMNEFTSLAYRVLMQLTGKQKNDPNNITDALVKSIGGGKFYALYKGVLDFFLSIFKLRWSKLSLNDLFDVLIGLYELYKGIMELLKFAPEFKELAGTDEIKRLDLLEKEMEAAMAEIRILKREKIQD